ncbi:KpsF/GutQ family sugar-phosphate isomerase [Zavarzinia sp. CC-PAN008]|uniref:KpsF/GutQ family sugar-phosphate isomerase n=1 Tax=Zavarzinia sp. CC-PAN008 TaxID=3243332 RepID=UPI003F746886
MSGIESLSSPVPAPEAAEALGIARTVLAIEVQGLQALAQSLGAAFLRAVDLLAATRGRVVVSGMGKSGHVARKIAGTLASTGCPAQFVHPGEASHGDLGMVVRGDSLLLLSNSGETAELSDLIAHAKRFDIPLVAITARQPSTLADAADALLLLPPVKEACAIGMAPTTSTTMMMALGDALAVVLMARAGFSPDRFQELHPGGRLGGALRRARDLMHPPEALPLVQTGTPMADVLIEISARSFGCAGVVDQRGDLVGVITDGDLRRHMSAAMLAQPARQIMTPSPRTIEPGLFASAALRIMNEAKITCLFVVEGRRPVGLLHIHDCLRAGIA